MDILVLSDSHGMKSFAEKAIEINPDCKTVFFLGDGINDIRPTTEKYPDRKFYMVAGNNDIYSRDNTEAYKHIEGVTIMACHGHILNVRVTLRDLFNAAESVMAKLVLYGHTHIQNMYNDPITGICAVNPGAMCEGKYCVIRVEKGSFDIFFKDIYCAG